MKITEQNIKRSSAFKENIMRYCKNKSSELENSIRIIQLVTNELQNVYEYLERLYRNNHNAELAETGERCGFCIHSLKDLKLEDIVNIVKPFEQLVSNESLIITDIRDLEETE